MKTGRLFSWRYEERIPATQYEPGATDTVTTPRTNPPRHLVRRH